MDEADIVATFIEDIVAGAHIPGRAARDDLRRELWTHFEEAGTSSDARHDAMRRFGAAAMVTASLRQVYRWDYLLAYLVKIAASVVASIAAALAIEVVVNLRLEVEADVFRLAPGFPHAAVLATAVVLALATVREVCRAPFNRSRAVAAISLYAAVCTVVQLEFAGGAGAFVTAAVLAVLSGVCSRLAARPAQWLLTFLVFAAAEYGMHLRLSIAFGPRRALVASAVLVAVWSSTVFILAQVDHAFMNFFAPAHRRIV